MKRNPQEVFELTEQLRGMRIEYWLNETLFTFPWWLFLLSTIVGFIVWIIILDKDRAVEIIAYGLMVTITATIFDVLGVSLVLWQYKHPLIPLPILTGVHIILMPVIYMITYQYFHKWKTFLIAATVSAFIFAFILEPFLVWLQIYELHHWKYIYSFPFYVVIAAVFKWVIHKLKGLDKNYTKK